MSPLDEYRQANLRSAAVAACESAVPGDPLASNFCFAPVGLPSEGWPTFEDEPLQFVCQFNLTEAPAVPDLLQGVALLTLFVAADPGDWGQEQGDGWCLRVYETLDGLAPLTPPEGAIAGTQACGVTWSLAEDLPTYDDPDRVLPDAVDVDEADQLESIAATKLGGWAYNIQAEQWWHYRDHPAEPEYCLQINSEPQAGLYIGDAGIIYLARGTAEGCEDDWFMDWQCF
jgi:hypothetical protein